MEQEKIRSLLVIVETKKGELIIRRQGRGTYIDLLNKILDGADKDLAGRWYSIKKVIKLD